MLSPSTTQRQIAAFLLALEDVTVNGVTLPMQHVSVITTQADDDAGDLLTYDRVMQAIAGEAPRNGKFGLAIVIDRPVMKNAQPNGSVLVEDSEIVIEIIEDMGTNAASETGTGVALDDCRAAVAHLLHAWSHDGVHALIYQGSEPIPEKALEDHQRGWLLTFQSKAHGHRPFSRVARPVMSLASPLLTITCATSGAAILYSLDGSPPSTLYTAPVDVGELPSGTVIQALATKAGVIPSHTAALSL